jgi:hypothetical protein
MPSADSVIPAVHPRGTNVGGLLRYLFYSDVLSGVLVGPSVTRMSERFGASRVVCGLIICGSYGMGRDRRNC